jgi:hypothetical protein
VEVGRGTARTWSMVAPMKARRTDIEMSVRQDGWSPSTVKTAWGGRSEVPSWSDFPKVRHTESVLWGKDFQNSEH